MRKIFAALSIAAILVCVALMAAFFAPSMRETTSDNAIEPRDAAKSIQAAASTSPKTPKAALQGPTLLYKKFRDASSLSAAYFEFTLIADTTPEARYFMGQILLVCSNYSGETASVIESQVNQEQSPKQLQKRKTAFAKLKTSCSGIATDAINIGPATTIREAARLGDAKARAAMFWLKTPKNETDFQNDILEAQKLADTKDPVVINELANYFDARDMFLTWSIPGSKLELSGAEMARAFHLAACDFGLDCGPTTTQALAGCVRLGRCDYSDRSSDYQHYDMAPAVFSRVQVARRFITEALAANEWPNGFWAGTKKPR